MPATAKPTLANAAKVLAPYVADGVPIVGVEPSCTAVWRSDAPELLPDDARRELFEAMRRIAQTGHGPHEQTAGIGCSIKWQTTP